MKKQLLFAALLVLIPTVVLAVCFEHELATANFGTTTAHELSRQRLAATSFPAQYDDGSVQYDVESLSCLTCHDGSIGPMAHYSVGEAKAIGNSHRIGQQYVFKPGLSLSPARSGVVLVNGRVSCISCHDMAKPGNHLAVDMKGSALCLTCHRK